MIFLFTALSLSLIPKRSRLQKKDIEGFACTVCKGIATGVKTMVDAQSTVGEITTKLLSQCYTIAQTDKSYYPMCQELSTKYVQILIHLVGDLGEDSEKICVKLGYCSDLTAPFSRKSVQRNLRYLKNQIHSRQKTLSIKIDE